MPNNTQSQAGNIKPAHKEMIAQRLLAGESITQAQFCEMTHLGSRLAPRILDLKQRGYPIEKHMIKLSDGTHVAQYFLPKYFIKTVREFGLGTALLAELSKKTISDKADDIVERVA